MGYLFVDRILEIEAPPGGQGAGRGRGLKAVSRLDPYVRPDPGGLPELSPCFAGEAVGQLAAWIAMSRCGFARRPVAGLTAEAIVGRAPRPGDVMSLEVEIISLDHDAVHYHGKAAVGGDEVLAIRDAVGPMLPMEDFDDPGAVELEFRSLLRPGRTEGGEEESPPIPEAGLPPRSPVVPPLPEDHPLIDGILERDARRIVAATCVSRQAPYLEGHFPRNPVLPATLLLDSLVGLAVSLAAGMPGSTSLAREVGSGPVRILRLADLKMRDFVRPGTRLLSEARIRDESGDRALVEISARVQRRPILSGVVELGRKAAKE